MKRLIAVILIIGIILMIPYADSSNVKELYRVKLAETLKIDKFIRFVAHAQGKTYVVYEHANEIGDTYFYLATLENGKLKDIGEIDEMIGGNNEYNTYNVAGTTQYQQDYYFVTGMVQIDGEIYIAKKRHIYKLVGNRLEEIPLKLGGKPFVLSPSTVIGKFVTNGKHLFMTMSAVGTYITADSEDALSTPLDQQLIRIDKDGNMEFTLNYIPAHYALDGFKTTTSIHADFTVNSDETRVVYARQIYGTDILQTIEIGGTELDNMKADIRDPYSECHIKTIYINDELYTYQNSYKGNIDVIKVTMEKRIPYRDQRIYNAAWVCSTEKVAQIDNMRYILHWSLGDDGYLYAVTRSDTLAYDWYIEVNRIKL